MKDYSATITVTIRLQAPNDDQAQERAARIADRLIVGWENPTKLPAYKVPTWYDENGWEATVKDVTCESE